MQMPLCVHYNGMRLGWQEPITFPRHRVVKHGPDNTPISRPPKLFMTSRRLRSTTRSRSSTSRPCWPIMPPTMVIKADKYATQLGLAGPATPPSMRLMRQFRALSSFTEVDFDRKKPKIPLSLLWSRRICHGLSGH